MVEVRDAHHIQMSDEWIVWQQGGGSHPTDRECSQVVAYNLETRELASLFAVRKNGECSRDIGDGGTVVRHRFDGLVDTIAATGEDQPLDHLDLWVWDAETGKTRPLSSIANLTEASPIGAGMIAGWLQTALPGNQTLAAVDVRTGAITRAPATLSLRPFRFGTVIDGSDGVAYIHIAEWDGPNEEWSSDEVWSWDIQSNEARNLGPIGGALQPFTSFYREWNEGIVYHPIPGQSVFLSAAGVGNVLLQPSRIQQLGPAFDDLLGDPDVRGSTDLGFLSADRTRVYAQNFVNRTVACEDFISGCQRNVVASVDFESGIRETLDWPPDAPDRMVDRGGGFHEFVPGAPRLVSIDGYARTASTEVWAIELRDAREQVCLCIASPPKF